jgi:hypothetical protein
MTQVHFIMNPTQARGFKVGYWLQHNIFHLLGACFVFILGAAKHTIVSEGIAMALYIDRRFRWIFFGVWHLVKLWKMPCTRYLLKLCREWPYDRPFQASERVTTPQKSVLFVSTFITSSLLFHNLQTRSSLFLPTMVIALRVGGYICVAVITVTLPIYVLGCAFLKARYFITESPHVGLTSLFRFVQPVCWLAGALLRALQSLLSLLLQIQRHFKKALATRVDSSRKQKFSEMEPYRYKPLEHPRDIRLLRLGHLDSFADVTCEIIHASLEQAPEYEAISYTWGDPSPTCCVSVDGYRLRVPATAYEIIQGRCTVRGPRYLWMDFVCMDQSNGDEKKIQIPLMRDIYRGSSRVIAWLGNAPDGHNVDALLKWVDRELRPIELRRKAFQRRGMLQGNYGLEPRYFVTPAQFAALFNLLNNPFWQRVWIKQEIALGTEVHIVYSGYYVSWETLVYITEWSSHADPSSAQQALGPLGFSGKVPQSEMKQILAIASFREKLRLGQDIGLLELMYSFSQAKATIAQDKVYALLGLTLGPKDKTPKITYDPVEDVYLETASYLLSVECSLNFLHQAGIGYTRNPEFQRLPSWVPDWSTPPTPFPLVILRQDVQRIPYRYISLKNAPTCFVESSPVVYDRELVLQSTLLDEITQVGTRYIDASPDTNFDIRESLNGVKSWHDEICSMALSNPDPYPNGQPRNEALWRTLIGDRTSKQRPAPE